VVPISSHLHCQESWSLNEASRGSTTHSLEWQQERWALKKIYKKMTSNNIRTSLTLSKRKRKLQWVRITSTMRLPYPQKLPKQGKLTNKWCMMISKQWSNPKMQKQLVEIQQKRAVNNRMKRFGSLTCQRRWLTRGATANTSVGSNLNKASPANHRSSRAFRVPDVLKA